MNYHALFFYLFTGFVAVNVLDIFGSIASQKVGFSYNYLAVASSAIYVALGYFITKEIGFQRAVLINGLLGLYDGTIGFWLSVKFKANNGLTDEQVDKMMGPQLAMVMVIVAIALAGIGYGIFRFTNPQ
jgi:hypothetical protein